MIVKQQTLLIDTKGKMFTDLTFEVRKLLNEWKAHNGIVTVFAMHTTAGVKILENEILSLNDIMDHLDETAPNHGHYSHDRIGLRDVPPEERVNGVAHVRSLYFQHSIQLPVTEGKIQIGEWQTLFLVDFDGPRERNINISFIGTKEE
jgi:secondary thiamine-phosphate synthase enzyme